VVEVDGEVELGEVVVDAGAGADAEAGLLAGVEAAVLVELELGEAVEAAVEAGLPLLFAFAPQARVTAVRHISTTVLNNIFFIRVL
jgi:hypothetical protein